MSRYQPLFYRGSPASIPQVVAHLQKTLAEEDPNYTPLRQKMPPASIPDIVAHIQKYLIENQFVSVDELGAALAAYLEEHPEIVGVASINGETGNVIMDAGDIPLETGEDPTVAGAISYLSSALALLTTEAVQSVNGISPGTGQNVTITGANIPIDANTERTLDSTFSGATSEAAGAKGLVPVPGIGEQNRVLSGSGAWVDFPVQTVQKVCNVSPDNNHNVPLKGTDIPLQSMSLVTVTQAIDNLGNTFSGATAQEAGAKGLVPAPTTQDVGKFLSSGGGWATPSGGGDVQTVNNVSPDGNGNVALKGSDIPVSTSDSTKIDAALGNLNDQIGDLGDAIAYRINGNTSIVLIPSGSYVLLTDSTITGVSDGLYKAIQPIPANTAIDDTYLSSGTVSGGGLNDLNSKISSAPYAVLASVSAVETHFMSVWADMADGEIRMGCIRPSFSDTTTGIEGILCPVIYTNRSSTVHMAHMIQAVGISLDYYYNDEHHWVKM